MLRAEAVRTLPTLDALADEPTKAASLPLEAATALLARLSVAHAALTSRAVALALTATTPATGDSLLTVSAAAAKLNVNRTRSLWTPSRLR
jgi:hypothetical protein